MKQRKWTRILLMGLASVTCFTWALQPALSSDSRQDDESFFALEVHKQSDAYSENFSWTDQGPSSDHRRAQISVLPYQYQLKFSVDFKHAQDLSDQSWSVDWNTDHGRLWLRHNQQEVVAGQLYSLDKQHDKLHFVYEISDSGSASDQSKDLGGLTINYHFKQHQQDHSHQVVLPLLSYRLYPHFVSAYGAQVQAGELLSYSASMAAPGEKIVSNQGFILYLKWSPGDLDPTLPLYEQAWPARRGSLFEWSGLPLEKAESEVLDNVSHFARNRLLLEPIASDEAQAYWVKTKKLIVRLKGQDRDIAIDGDDPRFTFEGPSVVVQAGSAQRVETILIDEESVPHDGQSAALIKLDGITDIHGNQVKDGRWFHVWPQGLGDFISDQDFRVYNGALDLGVIPSIHGLDMHLWMGFKKAIQHSAMIDADMTLDKEELIIGEHLQVKASFKRVDNGDPVAAGLPVRLSTSSGFFESRDFVTDSEGCVEAVIDTSSGPLDKEAFVRAQCGSQLVSRRFQLLSNQELSYELEEFALFGTLAENTDHLYHNPATGGDEIITLKAECGLQISGPEGLEVQVDVLGPQRILSLNMDEIKNNRTPDSWGDHRVLVEDAELSDDLFWGEQAMAFAGQGRLRLRNHDAIDFSENFRLSFWIKAETYDPALLAGIEGQFALRWEQGRLLFEHHGLIGNQSLISQKQYDLQKWVKVECGLRQGQMFLMVRPFAQESENLWQAVTSSAAKNQRPLLFGDHFIGLIDHLRLYSYGLSDLAEIREEKSNGSNRYVLGPDGLSLTLGSNGKLDSDDQHLYGQLIRITPIRDESRDHESDDDDSDDDDSDPHPIFAPLTLLGDVTEPFMVMGKTIIFGSDEEDIKQEPDFLPSKTTTKLFQAQLRYGQKGGQALFWPARIVPGTGEVLDVFDTSVLLRDAYQAWNELDHSNQQQVFEFYTTYGAQIGAAIGAVGIPFLSVRATRALNERVQGITHFITRHFPGNQSNFRFITDDWIREIDRLTHMGRLDEAQELRSYLTQIINMAEHFTKDAHELQIFTEYFCSNPKTAERLAECLERGGESMVLSVRVIVNKIRNRGGPNDFRSISYKNDEIAINQFVHTVSDLSDDSLEELSKHGLHNDLFSGLFEIFERFTVDHKQVIRALEEGPVFRRVEGSLTEFMKNLTHAFNKTDRPMWTHKKPFEDYFDDLAEADQESLLVLLTGAVQKKYYVQGYVRIEGPDSNVGAFQVRVKRNETEGYSALMTAVHNPDELVDRYGSLKDWIEHLDVLAANGFPSSLLDNVGNVNQVIIGNAPHLDRRLQIVVPEGVKREIEEALMRERQHGQWWRIQHLIDEIDYDDTIMIRQIGD